MSQEKYIRMDVHQATISVAVMDVSGKPTMERLRHDCGVHPRTVCNSVADLRGGDLGCLAARSSETHVNRLVVRDPRKAALLKDGNKSGRIDARKLAEMLRTNQLKPEYHGEHGIRTLKELGRSYLTITKDVTRSMNRIKTLIPKLGHSLSGHKRLRSTSSRRLAGQDCGTRSSDSSRTVVPTRWFATGAPSSPTRTPAGEPPACGGAVTSPDSFHRSDSLGLAGGTVCLPKI